jgi:flagellar protein FlbD
MVTLTRLNGTTICVNAFLIEHIEETPDTIITLTNGHHFLVRESREQIVAAAVEFLTRLREQGIDPVAAGQIGRVT